MAERSGRVSMPVLSSLWRRRRNDAGSHSASNPDSDRIANTEPHGNADRVSDTYPDAYAKPNGVAESHSNTDS